MADSKGKDDKVPPPPPAEGADGEIKGLFDGEAPDPASPADPLGNLFSGDKAAPAPAARTEQSTLAVLGKWEGSSGADLKSTQLGVAPDAAGNIADDIAKAKAATAGDTAADEGLGLAKTQMGIAPETARQVEDALAAVMGEKKADDIAQAKAAAPAPPKPAGNRPLAKTQLGVAPGVLPDGLELPASPTASQLDAMPVRESLDMQELHSKPPSPSGTLDDGLGDIPQLPDLGDLGGEPPAGADGAKGSSDRGGAMDSLLDLAPTPAGQSGAPRDTADDEGGGSKRGLLLVLVGVVLVGGAVAVTQGGLLGGDASPAPVAKQADKPAKKADKPDEAAKAAQAAAAAPADGAEGDGEAPADKAEAIDPESGLDPSAGDNAPKAALGGDDKAARAAAENAANADKRAAADAKKAAREAKAAEKKAAADAKQTEKDAKRAARKAKQEAAERAAAEKRAAADAKRAADRAARKAEAERKAAEKAAAAAAAPKSAREVIVHAKEVVKKEPARAESLLREALTADPRNHRLMEALAGALLAQGRGKDAAELTAQIIQRRPKRASYRVIHGDALKAAGDEAGAKAQWEAALQVDPDNSRALRRLGR